MLVSVLFLFDKILLKLIQFSNRMTDDSCCQLFILPFKKNFPNLIMKKEEEKKIISRGIDFHLH